MTPKQRALAAFEHELTDRVPIYQGGFSSRAASHVLGREAYVGGGIQQYREAVALWNGPDAHAEYLERSRRDAFDLIKVLDLDVVRVSYWRMAEKPTKRLDENTFLYGDTGGAAWRVMRFDPQTELYQVVDRRPKGEPTLEEIEASVAAQEESIEDYAPQPEHFPHLLAALEEFGDERLIPGEGVGINISNQSTAWLEAIVLRPDVIARHLDVQAQRAAKMAECMGKMGLRPIFGGGDFCTNKGPLYSPKAFHELMLPRLHRISEACHQHGCFHCFASDGDLWPVADDLFGASGVDCFYEVDRVCGMDLAKLRQRFPHLALMGNISSKVLHVGTKEEVIAETLSCLEAAKEHGSIIVGCSNQIVAPTPPENIEAMMETLHRHR